MRRPILSAFLFLLASAAPGVAQDVELLAERHGTALPDGYFETMAGDQTAFRFARGRAARPRLEVLDPGGGPGVEEALRSVLPAMVLGPRDGPVTGVIRIPVLLGLFSDSPPDGVKFTRDQVQAAYFSDDPSSITAYYAEASGGRVDLLGDVSDWVRTSTTQIQATGGESGLKSGTVGPFILRILTQMGDVDWGLYDNDGPDAVPNSGDDDGYVDVLAVLHPTAGAECGGSDADNRIWSHRWSLGSAAGGPFVTSTPAAGGGVILIDDYVIQPVFACDGNDLNQIGVFTHELGHAFGLPDLYDTDDSDGKSSGAGNWDLMATGAWGCDGHSPDSPCHMGAWTKAVLGWANVTTVPEDTDLGTLTLPPVETTQTVYRVDAADGSGEFFLLENRQRIGFDRHLLNGGLLIWQVNPAILAAQWPWNGVNARQRMGVWLRQADGLNELGSGGDRGDLNDPFPFESATRENREFHAASRPAARSEVGTATGLTIVDIQRGGEDVRFRLLNRFTRVTVRSEGAGGAGGLFTINGTTVTEGEHTYLSAPFVENQVEAAPGESLEPGVRRPFRGWVDDPEAPRARTVATPIEDLELRARFEGRELELAMDVAGGQNGVEPGSFRTIPATEELWFPEGAAVSIEAVPQTGFDFLRWTGGLSGRPNPATVAMTAPVSAGAEFELIYALPNTTVEISAAVQQDTRFEPENGTAPFFWRVMDGVLPDGLQFETMGTLRGAAMETGTYRLTLEVRDALGLRAEGSITLDVSEPDLSVSQLASPFLTVGESLDLHQIRFLDRQGNGDGSYDLGDFRAWVLEHPSLPLSAPLRALMALPERVVIPTRPAQGGEGIR